MTKLPGAVAAHAIISDDCRRNRGNEGAFEEAIVRLRKQYDQIVDGWPIGSDVKIHLALTIERPGETRSS